MTSALADKLAAAFEQTDQLYPAWRKLVSEDRLEEALVLVMHFTLSMT